MSWHGIEGHDDVVQQFRRAIARGRLASTFLFVGPAGVGKHAFAVKFAQALLCQTRPEAALDPCETCDSCRQVTAGTHFDVIQVGLEEDKNIIPIEALIGDEKSRMRAGLCYEISLRPALGGRRIAIIDDADHLKQPEGSNCLLKTLEEPPPGSVLILISTSPAKQLPTIRSRSQIIRFAPLDQATVARLLLKHELAADATEAERLARFSEGSLQRAVELADPELWTFRQQLFAQLGRPGFDSLELAKSLTAIVDAAGKEAPRRRARARQIVNFAISFYRQLIRQLTGAPAGDDAELNQFVQRAAALWTGDEETAAACLDRAHDALAHIDRNVNLNIMLDCWIDDLATLALGGRLTPITIG